jgi:hypothetical protein
MERTASRDKTARCEVVGIILSRHGEKKVVLDHAQSATFARGVGLHHLVRIEVLFDGDEGHGEAALDPILSASGVVEADLGQTIIPKGALKEASHGHEFRPRAAFGVHRWVLGSRTFGRRATETA